jgi:hypothetical protein
VSRPAGAECAPGALAVRFDPDRVAYLETEGWRAYYDRRWLRVFGLMSDLVREQFHVPFPLSLVAALHVARGARAFAPVVHDDEKVERSLEAFYRMVRRWSGLLFDPRRVADLELRYWIVHRRLAGQRDHAELVRSLEDLHSATFGIGAEAARVSGERRSLAAEAVDRITSGTTADEAAEWRRVEDELRACYRVIQEALR